MGIAEKLAAARGMKEAAGQKQATEAAERMKREGMEQKKGELETRKQQLQASFDVLEVSAQEAEVALAEAQKELAGELDAEVKKAYEEVVEDAERALQERDRVKVELKQVVAELAGLMEGAVETQETPTKGLYDEYARITEEMDRIRWENKGKPLSDELRKKEYDLSTRRHVLQEELKQIPKSEEEQLNRAVDTYIAGEMAERRRYALKMQRGEFTTQRTPLEIAQTTKQEIATWREFNSDDATIDADVKSYGVTAGVPGAKELFQAIKSSKLSPQHRERVKKMYKKIEAEADAVIAAEQKAA